ncbi:MAG: hypothetical protein A3F72_04160 [Bacteroidetes bacterium RIFCSPLOWO2_12_FULL_35_15]|nr:MAG: hypothetical protein A3F72_04160 [Bacteroidetes bacterium RIFCSPLOWO2_12_FULL_35_15]
MPLLLFSFFLQASIVFAQHDTHHMQMKDTMKMSMDSMNMTSVFSNHLPMNRDGSGTSWQPDQSPMMMYLKILGKDSSKMTSLIFHGNIFLRYTSQDITKQSKRGGEKFDAPNWFMIVFSHKQHKNVFSFLSMFSLEQITESGSGYPLLFQSGETYNNIPLVDKQHPHDLFTELAINYTHSFTKNSDINVYFGYPGEPALGSGVFMHRLSAINNPDAPLGHHWQDATHITFGVGTIGFRYKKMKAEGSIFTGREPDENRYNFDKPTFDSYSYRISANPNSSFSLQFSQGFIKSPEVLNPNESVIRSTASIIHTKLLKRDEFIASCLVFGQNHVPKGKRLTSILLESNLKLAPLTIYARYEFIQKDGEELNLLQLTSNPTFNIQAFTLGFNKILFTRFKTDLSLGIQGTINFPDTNLKTFYGNNPFSAEIYLRIAPSAVGHHRKYKSN